MKLGFKGLKSHKHNLISGMGRLGRVTWSDDWIDAECKCAAVGLECRTLGNERRTFISRLPHPCPNPADHQFTCGFHIGKDAGTAMEYGTVLAILELAGVVIECEQGYRAESARIHSLVQMLEEDLLQYNLPIISREDAEILLDCEIPKGMPCDYCGDMLLDDDLYPVDDMRLCEECYTDNYGGCELCGEVDMPKDYIVYEMDTSMCEDCYQNNISRCSACNETCWSDDMFYHEEMGENICDGCAYSCDACGKTLLSDELEADGNCRECNMHQCYHCYCEYHHDEDGIGDAWEGGLCQSCLDEEEEDE